MNVLFALSLMLLSGCGVETSQPDIRIGEPIPKIQPNEPDEPGEPKVEKPIVVVFGAPWCGPCKRDLPTVQAAIKPHLDDLDFVFYVTTGYRSNELPTQEIADKYRDYLGLSAVAAPDVRWGVYRAIFGSSLSIPAVAVLRADRTVFYSSRRVNAGDLIKRALSLKVSK